MRPVYPSSAAPDGAASTPSHMGFAPADPKPRCSDLLMTEILRWSVSGM